jgi:hypothetical protein
MARTTRTSDGDTPAKVLPPDATATAGNGVAPPDEISAEDFPAPDGGTREACDDFDSLENFALPQDFDPGVLEEDPPVVVRKPSAWDFFRVHPDPAMTLTVGIAEVALLDALVGQMIRRPFRGPRRVTSEPMTPEKRIEIRAFARAHPELTQTQIALALSVNQGRVSETLHGFRE